MDGPENAPGFVSGSIVLPSWGPGMVIVWQAQVMAAASAGAGRDKVHVFFRLIYALPGLYLRGICWHLWCT